MQALCFYFTIHHAFHISAFTANEVDVKHEYGHPELDRDLTCKLATEYYLPANQFMLALIRQYRGAFRISYSISGTALEQFRLYCPAVIASFRALAATGCVEFLSETYYHSFSAIYSKTEFKRQVLKQRALVQDLFGLTPCFYRNTGMTQREGIVETLKEIGINGMLSEGMDGINSGNNNNYVYQAALPTGKEGFAILLRNPSLSEDIVCRYGHPEWTEHPLTAEKFTTWIHAHPAGTEVINLCMDYAAFASPKKTSAGIYSFFQQVVALIADGGCYSIQCPSNIKNAVTSRLLVPVRGDNLTTNLYQNNTLRKVYSLEKLVEGSGCETALDNWGRLQSTDHFEKMSDNAAHAENSYHSYLNILADFEIGLIRQVMTKNKSRFSIRKAAALF